MNGISLFTGIGGLEIALKRILPISPIFYLEREIPSVSILIKNMREGTLPDRPVYSNIESFLPIASQFIEECDWLSAGFPCQPHSSAGKRESSNDERWLWDDIIEVIRLCRPSFIFLENVSNLLNQPDATSAIFGTLSESGYDARWSTLRASHLGVNHHRNRLFIFAYLPTELQRINSMLQHPDTDSSDTNGQGYAIQSSQLATNDDRQYQNGQQQRPQSLQLCPSHPSHPNHVGWRAFISRLRLRQSHTSRCLDNFNSKWWEKPPIEPPLCRMDDGFSTQLHRLRSLGNAVVPIQAAHAFYHLIRGSNQ